MTLPNLLQIQLLHVQDRIEIVFLFFKVFLVLNLLLLIKSLLTHDSLLQLHHLAQHFLVRNFLFLLVVLRLLEERLKLIVHYTLKLYC